MLSNDTGRGNLASLIGYLRGEYSTTAPGLARVLVNSSALAVTIIGDDEQFAVAGRQVE